MSYKYFSQNEHYQVYTLTKAGHNQPEIARTLGSQFSPISREVGRYLGLKDYPPNQAQELACQRAKASRNAPKTPEDTKPLPAYLRR